MTDLQSFFQTRTTLGHGHYRILSGAFLCPRLTEASSLSSSGEPLLCRKISGGLSGEEPDPKACIDINQSSVKSLLPTAVVGGTVYQQSLHTHCAAHSSIQCDVRSSFHFIPREPAPERSTSVVAHDPMIFRLGHSSTFNKWEQSSNCQTRRPQPANIRFPNPPSPHSNSIPAPHIDGRAFCEEMDQPSPCYSHPQHQSAPLSAPPLAFVLSPQEISLPMAAAILPLAFRLTGTTDLQHYAVTNRLLARWLFHKHGLDMYVARYVGGRSDDPRQLSIGDFMEVSESGVFGSQKFPFIEVDAITESLTGDKIWGEFVAKSSSRRLDFV